MKILIATPLYPPEIGGPATYTRLLEQELPKRGEEVRVVKFSEVKSYPKIIRHFKFGWLVYKSSKWADIVYAQDPVSVGLPTFLVSKLRRRKFVLKVVGDYAWEQGRIRFGVKEDLDKFSLKYVFYHPLVMIFKIIQLVVAKSAHQVVVPSNYLKKIVSNWGVKTDNISVVYNSFSKVSINKTREEVRQDFNLDGFILISVGRLVPWKGFDNLIKTVKELQVKIPDIKLLIAGSGPDGNRLKELVIAEDLVDRVSFLGHLDKDNLFKYIKASDMFVLNTSYEGLSHQILEVMSLEVPVVSTDVGGNPELINTGETGLLVEPGNINQLTSAIMWLYKSPQSGIDLAEKAYQSLDLFGTKKMIEDLLEVLRKV